MEEMQSKQRMIADKSGLGYESQGLENPSRENGFINCTRATDSSNNIPVVTSTVSTVSPSSTYIPLPDKGKQIAHTSTDDSSGSQNRVLPKVGSELSKIRRNRSKQRKKFPREKPFAHARPQYSYRNVEYMRPRRQFSHNHYCNDPFHSFEVNSTGHRSYEHYYGNSSSHSPRSRHSLESMHTPDFRHSPKITHRQPYNASHLVRCFSHNSGKAFSRQSPQNY